MNLHQRKTYSKIDLTNHLCQAGLKQGDTVLVHSSLRSVGWILGGIRELINAFKDVIGEQGTLVMPTFTFSLKVWNQPVFDARYTPSRVGLLTEVFRRTSGVERTNHPTHSVAAYGRYASDIVSGPLEYSPLGIGSPLDTVRKLDGKILLMGVGQSRNSTVHLAESLAQSPYLKVMFSEGAKTEEAWYYDPESRKPTCCSIDEMPGSSEGFEVLDELLLSEGLSQTCKIGDATSQIMNSRQLCDRVVSLLQDNPTALLDHHSPSVITQRRLAFMETQLARGESH